MSDKTVSDLIINRMVSVGFNQRTQEWFIYGQTDDDSGMKQVDLASNALSLLQDESSLDEKKSVAFKVMVDTKEIEAENMGPAQRKAEAEKKMEANRKKLQDEGNEEDENDEESAKL